MQYLYFAVSAILFSIAFYIFINRLAKKLRKPGTCRYCGAKYIKMGYNNREECPNNCVWKQYYDRQKAEKRLKKNEKIMTQAQAVRELQRIFSKAILDLCYDLRLDKLLVKLNKIMFWLHQKAFKK